MPFDDILAAVKCDGRPIGKVPDDEQLHMRAKVFRSVLRDVYEAGEQDGFAAGRRDRQSEMAAMIAASPIDNLSDSAVLSLLRTIMEEPKCES